MRVDGGGGRGVERGWRGEEGGEQKGSEWRWDWRTCLLSLSPDMCLGAPYPTMLELDFCVEVHPFLPSRPCLDQIQMYYFPFLGTSLYCHSGLWENIHHIVLGKVHGVRRKERDVNDNGLGKEPGVAAQAFGWMGVCVTSGEKGGREGGVGRRHGRGRGGGQPLDALCALHHLCDSKDVKAWASRPSCAASKTILRLNAGLPSMQSPSSLP